MPDDAGNKKDQSMFDKQDLAVVWPFSRQSRNRRATDIESTGYGALAFAGGVTNEGLLPLGLCQFRPTSESHAVRQRAFTPRRRAPYNVLSGLAGNVTDECRKNFAEFMGRIRPRFGKRPISRPARRDLIEDAQRLERAAPRQPVEGSDDHHIAGSQRFEHLLELAPIVLSSTFLLAKDAATSSRAQSRELNVQLLSSRTDTGIPVDKHCRNSPMRARRNAQAGRAELLIYASAGSARLFGIKTHPSGMFGRLGQRTNTIMLLASGFTGRFPAHA
jgi:hypothetical protein